MELRLAMEKELERNLDRRLDRLSLNAFAVCVRKSADRLHGKAVDLLGGGPGESDASVLKLIFDFLHGEGKWTSHRAKAGGGRIEDEGDDGRASEVAFSDKRAVGGEMWVDRLARAALPSKKFADFVDVKIYRYDRTVFEEFVHEDMLFRELEELVYRRLKNIFVVGPEPDGWSGLKGPVVYDTSDQHDSAGGLSLYLGPSFTAVVDVVTKDVHFRERGGTVGELCTLCSTSTSLPKYPMLGNNGSRLLKLAFVDSAHCFECGRRSVLGYSLDGKDVETGLTVYGGTPISWLNGEARCGNCWQKMLDLNSGEGGGAKDSDF